MLSHHKNRTEIISLHAKNLGNKGNTGNSDLFSSEISLLMQRNLLFVQGNTGVTEGNNFKPLRCCYPCYLNNNCWGNKLKIQTKPVVMRVCLRCYPCYPSYPEKNTSEYFLQTYAEGKPMLNLTLLYEQQKTNAPIAELHYKNLPPELVELIDCVGMFYKADTEEIADMKAHVLHFINEHPDNLQTALNGFHELKAEIF